MAMMLGVSIACAVPAATAASVPISGTVKVLRSSGKVRFISRDAAVVAPAPDAPGSPTAIGLLVELFTQEYGVPRWAPPHGWKVSARGFRHRGTEVWRARFKTGRLDLRSSIDVGLPLRGKLRSFGVRITQGSTQLCAWFDEEDVTKDHPRETFVGKIAVAESDCGPLTSATTTTLSSGSTTTTSLPGPTTTSVPGSSTTSTTVPPGACGDESTLQVIQDRIFNARGCSTSTCHGAFNTSGLDLRPGSAYLNLVGVAATNAIAAAAGKKRVVPGDAAASFLSQKLHGALAVGEGVQMPSVGRALNATELAVVDAWIATGAPATGEVPSAPCLHHDEYEPAPALPVPPGGHQLVLTGPTLQPGQEAEGCLWVPTPNTSDFLTGKFEFSLNPGTHHFAIFEWNKASPPVTNVWTPNDFGCFSGAEFGNNVSGSPQAPYYVDAYPAGVARRLVAGKYLGLNAHYYNEFHVPIQVKVYINIHPYVGPTPAVAQTIVDIDDTFSISIPPFTVGLHPPLGAPRARWTNTSAKTWAVINLGGHMHHRGLRFTAWAQGGTKLYESFDWGHPNARYFTPTLDLPPGGYIDYECLYDNGVDRPVRTNAFGSPVTLTFGVSAEDAMCILTGQYYPK